MKRHKLLSCILPSLLLIAATASFGAPAQYTQGHADIGLGVYDEQLNVDVLELHLHVHPGAIVDGVPLVSDGEYAPDDAVIVVPFASQSPRPADPPWNAVGVGSGQPFWYLPQTLDPSVPFLGIGAEDMQGGTFDNDMLQLRLLSLSGPGQFSVWQTDGFGSTTFFVSTALNGSNNPAANKVTGIYTPSHGHFGWGFSSPGAYHATFEAYGTVNGVPQTDVGTFTFQVVPEPGSLGLLAAGAPLVALAIWRRRGRTT